MSTSRIPLFDAQLVSQLRTTSLIKRYRTASFALRSRTGTARVGNTFENGAEMKTALKKK
jgi:hypothetical protein